MSAQTADAIQRHFTTPEIDPLDAIEWERRDAWPGNEQYHRPAIEVPASWSQQTLDVTSKLYLARGGYSEDSVRAMIERVAARIREEGIEHGYFGDSDADVFYDELRHILVNQMAAFNSPVWFNVGREDRTQVCSACYLLSVEDNSESIMQWACDEVRIFRAGAGSGVNVSNIRGSMESLSTGGTASGPVSFMRGPDALAGTFKSGGTTRRAAKFVGLDDDHPDVRDFIWCKAREEERLRALMEAGYDLSLDEAGERLIADATSYQNANNSVRLSDAFMRQVENGERRSWPLIARKKGVFEGDVVQIDDAPDLLDEIAKCAWACADPGVQFHDTINSWHTTPNDGPIRTSNPCNETLLPDDSSCNLASINVLAFTREDGSFDVVGFRHTVDVMILAMDILVEFCEQPTERITERTKRYRWLGLGYANMGAAIMAQGLPYDSDEARDFAASITALMTGRAYFRSALLAQEMGAFEGFQENAEPMLDVVDKHLSYLPEQGEALTEGEVAHRPSQLWSAAVTDWQYAASWGQEHGYRNAQVTVIAPTGSISFLMGCDSTGIEPVFSLTTHKQLAGGGSMKLVNGVVKRAARTLGGYSDENLAQLAEGDSSCIAEEDKATFHGANEIAPEGHVRMVAAVQPFLCGAPSKTVNMPASSTWEDVREVYKLAWRLGVKCIAIYRDGSKTRQVLSTEPKAPKQQVSEPFRRRLPVEREAIVHKFEIGGSEGYVTAGKHPDGSLGEIFVGGVGKDGSTLLGIVNAWAIAVSIGLQYGVPIEVYARKYFGMSFPPAGITRNPEIRTARSLPDYVVRWLVSRFLPQEAQEEFGVMAGEVVEITPSNGHAGSDVGMMCTDCGGLMVRTGTCYACPGCGATSGCG